MNNNFIKLVKNFLYSSAYELIAIIIAFITAPYLSRVLDIDVKGEYDYARSIVNYFLLFGMLGFSLSGNRLIAFNRKSKNELNNAFTNNYTAQLIICIISSFSYYMWCFFTAKPILYYIVGIVVLSGIFDVGWFYQGIENFRIIAFVRGIVNIIMTIGIFVFVNDSSDIVYYAVLMGFSLAISNFLLFTKLKNYIEFTKIDPNKVKLYIKESIILFIPVISASVYKSMDKIMIGSITGNMAWVSSYSYAEQLINFPLGITNALAAVMLPRMTNAYANKSQDATKTSSVTLLFICFLSCAMSFGLAAISNVFVPLYLGKQYLDCSEYVIMLSVTAIMISWTAMMRTQFLIPKRNDKAYISSIVCGAILNLIINFLLLPHIGVYGAIIGTILAEGVVMVIQTIAASKYYNIKKAIVNGIPFLVFGTIMMMVCKLISNINGISWSTLVLQIVVGGTVYLLLSLPYLYWKYKKIVYEKC